MIGAMVGIEIDARAILLAPVTWLVSCMSTNRVDAASDVVLKRTIEKASA